jgi:RNA polymerase sigma factor for flagellar operon FliA
VARNGMSGTQPSTNVNRDALIEQHLHYVRTIAYEIVRKLPPNIELEELIAYGNLGLVRAAEKYNPARGVSFVTFAHYYIKGAIWDEVRKMANFARIDGGRLRAEANATDFLHSLLQLGLSRSWGSRLHARAIKRLREAMQREGLLRTDETQ